MMEAVAGFVLGLIGLTLCAAAIAFTVAVWVLAFRLARDSWREHLYRCLTKQSHGDLANGDGAVFGDWPRIPDDFPTHNGSDTL